MEEISFIPLSKDKAIIRSAGIILIFVFLIAARIYNPFESGLITCQFKDLTGYDCPTCGLSRSVHSFLSLNILDSIGYHPLGGVLILGLFVLLVKFTAELITGKELIIPITRSCRRFMIYFVLLLVFSTWMLKLCIGAT